MSPTGFHPDDQTGGSGTTDPQHAPGSRPGADEVVDLDPGVPSAPARAGTGGSPLAHLLELATALGAAATLEELAESVPTVVRSALRADVVLLGVVDPRHPQELRHLAKLGLRDDLAATWTTLPLAKRSPPTDAARGATVVSGTAAEAAASYPHLREVLLRTGGESTVDLPLRTAGGVVGALGVAWSEPTTLDAEDRAVLDALCTLTAQAVDRLQTAARLRSTAETLQRSLLPTVHPAYTVTVGEDTGTCEAQALYRAAATGEEVGGDWYDVVRADDGSLVVAVGDVTGHDVRAAAAMGQLRGLLRTVMWNEPHPAHAAVQRLERTAAGLEVQVTASLLLVRLTPPVRGGDGSWGVTWSNAGHPPPVLLPPEGPARVLGADHDLLLGIDPGTVRHTLRGRVPAGSRLAMVTDGVLEQQHHDLDTGLAAFCTAVEEGRGLPWPECTHHVLDSVAGSAPDDDCALVVLRL